MSAIAIIPARGGSKRIPKKNIKDFCGKPIIAYGIEAALKSGLFDEVMVSTDSEEIAGIARKYGANVPFMREDSLADDFATTDDVVVDVIKKYRDMGKIFKWAACIYPTAPFVTDELLKKAVDLIETMENAVQVMPMIAFSYPPQRAHVIGEDGMAVFQHPEYISTRSQDLEKMYHDAGQFYVYDADYFVKHNGIILDHTVPLVLDEMCAQDIDTEEDWKLAELKYKIIHHII
jgi:N-acylneuraminate cytidylyltransferase